MRLRQTIDIDIVNDITLHRQHVFTYFTSLEAFTSRPAADRSMDVQQLQEILRLDQQITTDSRTTEERGREDDTLRV